MSWRTDIEAMPKGPPVERLALGPRPVMVWDTPLVILALKGGKVIASNWLEPSYKARRTVGRWRGLNVGEEPLAWMPWPTYP